MFDSTRARIGLVLTVMIVLFHAGPAAAWQQAIGRFIYQPNLHAEQEYYQYLQQNGTDAFMAHMQMGIFRSRIEPDRRMAQLFDELVQKDAAGMNELLARYGMTFVSSSGQAFGAQ